MSKKAKMFNKYALHNASILSPIMIENIKKGDYLNSATGILKCVVCGCYTISGPIVSFYGYRAEALKCYGCQKKERLANNFVPVGKVLSTRFNF